MNEMTLQKKHFSSGALSEAGRGEVAVKQKSSTSHHEVILLLSRFGMVSSKEVKKTRSGEDMERIQKAAVKEILGNDYDNYTQALSKLKMENLNKRREDMALKFAKKMHSSKLFLLRDINHGKNIRNSEKYHVNVSKTNRRYKQSAIPYLQRLLNKGNFEKRQSFIRLGT